MKADLEELVGPLLAAGCTVALEADEGRMAIVAWLPEQKKAPPARINASSPSGPETAPAVRTRKPGFARADELPLPDCPACGHVQTKPGRRHIIGSQACAKAAGRLALTETDVGGAGLTPEA